MRRKATLCVRKSLRQRINVIWPYLTQGQYTYAVCQYLQVSWWNTQYDSAITLPVWMQAVVPVSRCEDQLVCLALPCYETFHTWNLWMEQEICYNKRSSKEEPIIAKSTLLYYTPREDLIASLNSYISVTVNFQWHFFFYLNYIYGTAW